MNTFDIKLYEKRSVQYRYHLDEFGDPEQYWVRAYALCKRETIGDDELVLSRVFYDLDDAIDSAGLLLDEPDWWNRSLFVDFDAEWGWKDFWSNGYDDTKYVIVHYPDDNTSPPVRMLVFVKKER